MLGTVGALRSQRDRDCCEIPLSFDNADALIARGPDKRCTMRARNPCEYTNRLHSDAPWRTCGKLSPPAGGDLPQREASGLRPADASHRLGPAALLKSSDNNPDAGGQCLTTAFAVTQDDWQPDTRQDLLQVQRRVVFAKRTDLVEILAAIHFDGVLRELLPIVHLVSRPEGDEALVHSHAVGNRCLGLQLFVG